jgi:hypothetical protein
MLAIVSAFIEWIRYLESIEYSILVYFDDKKIKYITMTKVPN